MLGTLTDRQIEHVLQSQVVGRIGCSSNGKVYIVPVTYAYHDGHIYAHSQEGQKVAAMRSNPHVCFQVDSIDNMANWRSVVVWGNYEELRDPAAHAAAMSILTDRLTPLVTSQTVQPTAHHALAPQIVEKGYRAVAYRIKITERTGRYEKTDIR